MDSLCHTLTKALCYRYQVYMYCVLFILCRIPIQYQSSESDTWLSRAGELYSDLQKVCPGEVLLEDRTHLSVGARLRALELIGCPNVIIIGPKVCVCGGGGGGGGGGWGGGIIVLIIIGPKVCVGGGGGIIVLIIIGPKVCVCGGGGGYYCAYHHWAKGVCGGGGGGGVLLCLSSLGQRCVWGGGGGGGLLA